MNATSLHGKNIAAIINRDSPTLTVSGKGLCIPDKLPDDFSLEQLHALLKKYHWIVFKCQGVQREQVIEWVSRFGPLTENSRRTQGVLQLDGSKSKEGQVLLGNGFLPLHRDGALMGTDVYVVGIFCERFRNVKQGRTFITDLENAMLAIPTSYLDVIQTQGIEGQPVDSYYLKSAQHWHKLPGFITVEDKAVLNIGLPYPKGERASWRVRIPGIAIEASDRILFDIAKILMNPTYCYYHNWAEGDLLLFNNKVTLHGREAFTGERILANIQALTA